jgi:N-acetyl-gamma-glutamyl-phosphate reductase
MAPIFVDGQEGTTGLRIHEYLARAQTWRCCASTPTSARTRAERARLLNAADVAFLCLPDAAAREAAALVTNPKTCLIDASTAHRTVPGWAFGLPELAPGQREACAPQAHRQPGLPRHGLHPAAAPAGGRRPAAGRCAGQRHVDHRLLGRRQEDDRAVRGGGPLRQRCTRRALTRWALAHKHLPEMMAHTGLARPPVFMPVVASFYKGLAVSVPLHLASGARHHGEQLQQAWRRTTPASASSA